ncbi:hypothetical protein AM629_17420 [Photorhabdus heterorhabditis]|uniref:Big-1 domain-containing protein n=1 Tax=Photorhabdus heterorhabditis TaxID=880156 RepID=A0ABR5K8L2_9GAMM|nr:Ig-like domain-containing protein [Photorhabdus heterorhabditis]KOY60770.1 hypothetical protein AM629_17420 [Photorhabdus heterorhabditis]
MNDEQAPKDAKTLSWVSSKKIEIADKPIYVGINVIQDGYLLHGMNIILTLDNESMVFKENNERKITKNTGVMGEASVEIISVGSTPCQGNVDACLDGDTQIKASSLQIEFTAVPQCVTGINLDREKNNVWANSTDENIVVATVYDQFGKGIKGQEITFRADIGGKVFPSSGITDKDGKITVSIQSDSDGRLILIAQVGNIIKGIAVDFTYNPYQLKITKSPSELYSFSSGIITGYLYKNGIGEPNVTMAVSTGSYLSVSDEDKNMTTDKNGYFSFSVYSTYAQECSPHHHIPMSKFSSVGISCIDGLMYYQTWITLTPGLC